jgi:hypothetical protein
MLPGCGGDPSGAPLYGPQQTGAARQSYETNSRTNDYEVTGSADPLTGLLLGYLASARNCAALPVNLPRLSRFPVRGGLVTLSQIFVRRSQLALPRRVNDEQWDLFSPEF